MEKNGFQADVQEGLPPAGSRRKRAVLLLAWCVLLSAAFLAVCSKSSFLYPINDWGDANCFFTVGKSILHGKVLYRDIFDQKGPLLYFLHSIASLVSGNTFLGVYLIEAASFSWFLWLAAKTVRLFLPEAAAPILLPVLTALLLSSAAFCHGDSAEELCLPLVMAPVYSLVRYYRLDYPSAISYKQVLLSGVFAGCVLTIKFSLLGFHAAWLVSIVLACLSQKKRVRAFISLLVFLGGMLAALLPWLLYFLVNNALGDFWRSYFYDNIFLYSQAEDLSLLGHVSRRVSNLGAAFVKNLQFFIPIALGLAAVLFVRKYAAGVLGRLSLFFGFVLLSCGVFAGDTAYAYYSLILGVFAVFGLIAVYGLIAERWPRKTPRLRIFVPVVLAVAAASLAFSWARSSNTYLLGAGRQELAQYKFRDIILETENPTLLNYGFLDFGEYTVCGIEPTCKYFCGLNLKLPEIKETQDGVIGGKKVDYVITRGRPPSFVLKNYAVVAEQRQYFEDRTDTYYLLKKLP
jgi:hypothetical protein